MSDQTQATLSTQGELATDTALSAGDREDLRRLAAQVAELAARPIIHTVRNGPRRVVRRVEITRQEAEAL